VQHPAIDLTSRAAEVVDSVNFDFLACAKGLRQAAADEPANASDQSFHATRFQEADGLHLRT
jgi:hypothetical protein